MDRLKWGIFWVVVWDALWVPYEFMEDYQIEERFWEIEMISWWSWKKEKWTWSDDTSLTLCTIDGLLQGYNLKNIAEKFIEWKTLKIWNADHYIFDIWLRTSEWINTLIKIFEEWDFDCLYFLKNEADISSNWNWALMRILPILWVLKWENIKKQFDLIWQVWALTHPHIISAISCLIYIKFAEYLFLWEEKFEAFLKTKNDIKKFLKDEEIEKEIIEIFDDILEKNILEKENLISSWYVVNSLEVSIFCFLKYNSFEEILKNIIKFWWDTDTAAAICWWISWIYYWYEKIPEKWLKHIKRKQDIENLIEDFRKIIK